jgi:hypothetical protein
MDLVQPSTCGGRKDPQYFEPSNIGFQPIEFAVIRHRDTYAEDLRRQVKEARTEPRR